MLLLPKSLTKQELNNMDVKQYQHTVLVHKEMFYNYILIPEITNIT